jgi:hypothetical protein
VDLRLDGGRRNHRAHRARAGRPSRWPPT